MLRREDCLIRGIEEQDLDLVLRWRNSERIRTHMYTDHLISPAEHRSWFERVKQGNGPICKIFEHKGIPLGVVNFTQIDRNHHRCQWGFYIGESDAPKGSGSAMGYLSLQFAFEEINLNKVCAEVFAFNSVSLGYHKKLGFVEEGRFLQHVFKNGVYEDIVVLAAFQKNWRDLNKQLEKLCFEMGEYSDRD
ncbi:UDP-4-amino-4,6-dideoxy-N-acetyl-beta-L-altrosamine N-acetyltransferase [Effusibacillus lacus]|uniref:UDP-4-amino-4,6-dideoxy-N-acetyl-beta-L-altrosamine N-acetyltransferase n=1 Tax=Effusibacillus lacus TaxID=1348429 RepID=A0A292YJ23_9BACL|nr:UDP-4-amino-4,6-dideoxy-N-acetyl-beta-L-altrosamine N-acetyltransferase [Effusibacillus lacus]TCS69830.1 UDP-4-amino-4,6-dideoxy-N-acetyl-beta-L-altrosamine N-acetyltransferase [Effusibacillus lacus]GAX88911.1 UDP-4-amino-4,6-dideoxy-N-acetyl-beta-L-altrosamine N-acetyltransferase [Effusibacillus lacus]